MTIVLSLFLQEGCGFQIHGEKTQIYRVAPRHGDIMLAATGEIPIGGTGLKFVIHKLNLRLSFNL